MDISNQNGWTPDNPVGTLLLPQTVANVPLLRWVLAHGADPNLAAGRVWRSMASQETNSCAALEAAARGGHVEAVCDLLDRGAEMGHGVPPHHATGVCRRGLLW